MAKVIEEQGPDAIANNMGVDATGQVFNSINAVEQYKGAEMNAMVNPGAITATSMVSGGSRDEIWNKILAYYSDFAGRQLGVNQEVFKSEAETNQRNQAIAMLMYAYGHIKADPLRATDIYTRAVLGQRQREGPRDDGGDAGERRHESGHRQVSAAVEVRAERAGGDGHRRPVRRFRQVAVSRPACRARAASAAASSPCRPASSASR